MDSDGFEILGTADRGHVVEEQAEMFAQPTVAEIRPAFAPAPYPGGVNQRSIAAADRRKVRMFKTFSATKRLRTRAPAAHRPDRPLTGTESPMLHIDSDMVPEREPDPCSMDLGVSFPAGGDADASPGRVTRPPNLHLREEEGHSTDRPLSWMVLERDVILNGNMFQASSGAVRG